MRASSWAGVSTPSANHRHPKATRKLAHGLDDGDGAAVIRQRLDEGPVELDDPSKSVTEIIFLRGFSEQSERVLLEPL